jgi:PAS domain-containing protein
MTQRDRALDLWPEMWIGELLILGLAAALLWPTLPFALLTSSALASTAVAAAISRSPHTRSGLLLGLFALGAGLGAALFAPQLSAPLQALIIGVLGALALGAMALGGRRAYFRLGVAGTLCPVLAGVIAQWSLGAACALVIVVALAALMQLTAAERETVIPRAPEVRESAPPAAADDPTFANALFESMPNPVAVIDYAGRFDSVNPAFVSLFGFTEAECRGRLLVDHRVPE